MSIEFSKYVVGFTKQIYRITAVRNAKSFFTESSISHALFFHNG